MIICDFDHTLFNTEAFKEKMAHSFGLSFHDFIEETSQWVDTYNNYDFFRHLQRFPENEQEKILEALRQNLEGLIFNSMLVLIEAAQNVNMPFLILSRGIENFQHFKINGSLDEKIKDMVIVSHQKEVWLQQFIKTKSLQPDQILFINDKPNENDLVEQLNPGVSVYEVISKYGPNHNNRRRWCHAELVQHLIKKIKNPA
jgi:2-hydroxy-3-keto-5-methylthiopentenyl-1-phosphate phosphatase